MVVDQLPHAGFDVRYHALVGHDFRVKFRFTFQRYEKNAKKQKIILVHFGRIVLRAADIPVALTRIYDHPFGAPHAAAVVFERNLVL